VSPIIYGARLIYVSLLSGAFSKDTSLDVIHLFTRDTLPSQLA